MNNPEKETGIIAWFAQNPVAANLLMVAIIVMGLMAALTIRKQMFPLAQNTWINVSVLYRGAAPQEIEEAITIKLEEALSSVQGIDRLITRSNRGNASANIKILDSYQPNEVLDDIKSAIDAIASFPDGMESPRVTYTKFRQEVMYIALAGDVPLRQLKALGQQIHDDIRALPNVNISEFYSGPNYEIGIEISPRILKSHGLTLQEVANAIRQFSVNQSSGEVRTERGLISVRVENQAYVEQEFESIPVKTFADGGTLTLSDIADVRDAFEQGIHYTKANGKNLLTLFVGASEEQSITDIADTVSAYLDQQQSELPQGISLYPWVDFTYYLEGRLNMMLSNMFYGGILVFCILALFLRLRLAFWVMMGLPISFLGALAFLPIPAVDVTVNVASLFAFIMVLGVVVDDAIIIGESVQSEIQQKGQSITNVIRGAKRVATPATFGVLTTMAAFFPMILESGPNAAFPHAIGFVVVLCLVFSLVESKLILPAHLAHMPAYEHADANWLSRIRTGINRRLEHWVNARYSPFLTQALHYRYTVLSIFIGLIVLTGMMFKSGNIKYVNFPKIPHDYVRIKLEMNSDASESDTLQTALDIEKVIQATELQLTQEFNQPMVDKILVQMTDRTTAEIQTKLVDPDLRPISPFDLSARWRTALPQYPGMKQLTIVDSLFGGRNNDGDLSFKVKSRDEAALAAVSEKIKAAMTDYSGVYDVGDSERSQTQEVQFNLKPEALALGLTTSSVAQQMAQALYGLEAQRIVRDREEIRVMVRYPEGLRDSIESVSAVEITTPGGAKIPLGQIAELFLGTSSDVIYREDGNRAITLWASVDTQTTEPFKVADALKTEVFPELSAQYPSVQIEESGTLKEQREDAAGQIFDLLLILIPVYVLLALPLKSYTQPLMIMSVIPFGLIGAIGGHLLLGMNVSQMSVFGMFAVVGVVVNDSLVMVDFINKAPPNMPLYQQIIQAGKKRFRAIVLTSLTTFIGLMPIIFETSLQAKIVIPMAVSLAFGVLFATLVTLILVPCLYVIRKDIGQGIYRLAPAKRLANRT